MKLTHLASLPLCLLALFASACGSDDAGPGAGAGGTSSGEGGDGGKAVTAGTSAAGKGSAGSKNGGGSGAGGGAVGNGEYLIPAPLVCRGKQVESSPKGGDVVFDGKWDFDSIWHAPENGWLTINVGEGPSRLLFVWHHYATPDYTIVPEINFGAPTSYRIEVSPSGADGSWEQVVEVTGEPDDVSYRSAAHSFDFTGMSYVRFTTLGVISNQGDIDTELGEIEIHDISQGAEDTWAVAGFGQSRSTYHGREGLFPELIHAAHPGYYPALIDLAEIGLSASDLVGEIDGLLERNPDFHFWILAYGVWDAMGNRTPDEMDFKPSMQKVIDKLKAAGKVPLIPRIEKLAQEEHATIDQFNSVIDELVAENELPAAPDLWALFSENPDYLCSVDCEDDFHVGLDWTLEGEAAANEAWAASLDPLYEP